LEVSSEEILFSSEETLGECLSSPAGQSMDCGTVSSPVFKLYSSSSYGVGTIRLSGEGSRSK
jgi:hypothetical protein